MDPHISSPAVFDVSPSLELAGMLYLAAGIKKLVQPIAEGRESVD